MDSKTTPRPSQDTRAGVLESDVEASLDNAIEKTPTERAMEYPDGGARAWSVAIGAAGVLFCTFGYCNAYGSELLFPNILDILTVPSVYQEYYATHQLHDSSPSAISWIGSLQIFFLFSGNCFGGPLFDRFGSLVSMLLLSDIGRRLTASNR